MPIIKFPDSKATPAQIDYLEILFNDTGFTIAQKHDYIKQRWSVKFLDELTKQQASDCIGLLKVKKDELEAEAKKNQLDLFGESE